ncbi:MAG: C40 family peptidase [Proteobacteria bacterium]|nr:C40 family peptidase [Pseudomonadota bacterium]
MSPADPPEPLLDPRTHPYRGDIAADFLEGRVESESFVAGRERRLGTAQSAVMTKPITANSILGVLQASELLFGEAFTVYDESHGWAWGQCGHDGQVGYVAAADLYGNLAQPTHWVTAAHSLVFPDPKGEYPAMMSVSMTARVAVDKEEGEYVRLASGGWMFGNHLAPLGEIRSDFIATAQVFTRVPYLWGGRGGLGIDCSGLVQVPLAAAGIAVPRDSDQQADAVGEDIEVPEDVSDLRPGDILFFPGHVGFYLGSGAFLHASSFGMMVATHTLAEVLERIHERHGTGITRVRRVKVAG